MIKTIIPWSTLGKANKKVRDKIDKINQGDLVGNIDYMKGYENIDLNEVEKFFEKTLGIKKSLEDKLKTSLFSVTLGITVLTSAISLLFNDGVSSLNSFYKGIIFATGSIAVIYMMLAGIFAIKTISGYISVYQIFPEDISNKSDSDKKKLIAICAELNSLSNTIRQNLMNVSFHCIINSLFVMMIFFFLVGAVSFIESEETKKIPKVEVVVQPNKNSIELLNSRISEIDLYNKLHLNNLQNEITNNKETISTINSRIEESRKEIEINRANIEKNIKAQEKSSALTNR